MENNINKIAILTSGGDAPGMNAAVIYAVDEALNNGLETYVVYEGYKGLVEGNIKKITSTEEIKKYEDKGGTFLYTARYPEFKEEEVRLKAKATLDNLGIDALVVIGGDGSFMGAKLLSDIGVKTVGIPGTIDNDIQSSEYTLGFFTAIETLSDIISKVRDTAESHNRLFVIEAYGHGAGDLPIFASKEVEVDILSVPELKLKEEDIIHDAKRLRESGKRSIIILVAEFLYDSTQLAKQIQSKTGIESKTIIPLQIQRGGKPVEKDKKLANILSRYAVQELLAGHTAITVGTKDWKPYSTDIIEAVNLKRKNYDEIIELYNKEN